MLHVKNIGFFKICSEDSERSQVIDSNIKVESRGAERGAKGGRY